MDVIDIGFAAKLASTAMVVLVATLIAERAGAFVGAMIVALPISAGPAYLFLALDHDAMFIAESARISLGVNALVPPFLLVAAVVIRKAGLVAALGVAFIVWGGGAVVVLATDISLIGAVLLNIVSFIICLPLSRPLLAQPPAQALRRGYIDIIVRVIAVMAVVGTAIIVGRRLGPEIAGIAAVAPVVWTSLTVVVYARSGRAACSAILANGIGGMIGFAMALPAVALLADPIGWPLAFIIALGLCVAWSTGLTFARPYIPLYRIAK